jgi:hypothetical protein
MVYIHDADNVDNNGMANGHTRQLYAAIILRAITDIQFPPDPKFSEMQKKKRKYKIITPPFNVSNFAAAMMWVFNEKDYSVPPTVPFSYCCEVLEIDPITIQKYCAKLILQNKTPHTGDKASTGGELLVDTRVFRLI